MAKARVVKFCTPVGLYKLLATGWQPSWNGRDQGHVTTVMQPF